MDRPTLPAVVVAALLLTAGCVGTLGGPGGTDGTTTSTATTSTATTTEPTTDTTTTRRTTDEGHYRKYEFRVREVTPVGIAEDVVPPRSALYADRSVTRPLFENGTARAVTIVRRENLDQRDSIGPIEDGQFVREAGNYYRVNATVVDRREAQGYEMDMEGPIREEYHEDEYDRATREAVNFSALSPADRRLFAYRVPSEERRESAIAHIGFVWTFPDDVNPDESILVDGEVHYVRHRGDLFRVQFEGERPRVVRFEVRYDLERVANSSAEFVEGRLDSLVTPLNESESPERDVLLRAIEEDGFSWEGTHRTVPDEYRKVEAWLVEHPPDGRVAYVRHEGTIYRIYLYKVME